MSDGDPAVRAGVVRAVGAIGLATLASRILGYARDIVLARAFGATPLTDAFFVAFRIPNLLRRLLAEGALSTAIIPVFSETLARGGPVPFGRMVRAVAGVGTRRPRRGVAPGNAAGPMARRAHGARLAGGSGALRPGGEAHPSDVSVSAPGGARRAGDGRAEHPSALLHGGPRSGNPERRDDRSRARARPANESAHPRPRRSACSSVASGSFSSSSPSCAAWACR